MIRSLVGTGVTAIDADIVVIGAGTVGLPMARRLAAAGHDVVVLESGGLRQDVDEHPFNAVAQTGMIYGGAAHGRFRCLGGTSTRWGGAMLPFRAEDVEGSGWPIGIETLLPYAEQVRHLFALPEGPFDLAPDPATDLPGFVARAAKWPPFDRRNVCDLPVQRGGREPAIWLNAVTTDFSTSPAGRLTAATARSVGGDTMTIRAGQFVIAAGAIESTRLLLLLDTRHDRSIFGAESVLGRGFHDHLSAVAGRLRAHDRRALNRIMGFRFKQRGMESLRYEPDRRTRRSVPAGFAQFGFGTADGSSFSALREVYRSLQRRSLPGFADVRRLAGDLPALARMAWWRWYERRLLYPDDAEVELNIVVEQRPRSDNRITLARQTDRFSCPLASIDWRVAGEDQHGFTQLADAFIEAWGRADRLRSLGEITRRPTGEAEADLAAGGGIYHPGGTIRMGSDAANGIVDVDLRAFRVPNLTVASTAVFPTGGSANPTMMLLMLGLRAADAIIARHRR